MLCKKTVFFFWRPYIQFNLKRDQKQAKLFEEDITNYWAIDYTILGEQISQQQRKLERWEFDE